MTYLEEYGQADLRREKFVKALVALLLISLVLGIFYYIFFRNWREELQAKHFLRALEETRYEEAYSYWGCTVAEPCRYYPYDEFLEDWGPESPLGKVRDFHLGGSYTQKTGVIITLTINGRPQPNLWVEKESKTVGFFPY